MAIIPTFGENNKKSSRGQGEDGSAELVAEGGGGEKTPRKRSLVLSAA